MQTIIKIIFNQYSENGLVHNLQSAHNLAERMKNDSDFVRFEIVQEGDDIEEVERILFPSKVKEIRIEIMQYDRSGCQIKNQVVTAERRNDGKIRLETGMSDWGMRFQKLKQGANGEYITIFNQRWYVEFL